MIEWKIVFSDFAKKDYKDLDGDQKKHVVKMLKKLASNPLPIFKGGYGHPLGNNEKTGNLTGLYKLKSRGSGLRIVYELIEDAYETKIIIIGMREDHEVYKEAVKRLKENG